MKESEKPVTVAELEAAYPLQVTAIRQQAAAEATTTATTAERERILAIEKLAQPGLEELIATAKADSTCTAPITAMRILEHEKQLRANGLKQLAGDEDPDQKPKAGATSAGEPNGDRAVAARVLATHKRLNP